MCILELVLIMVICIILSSVAYICGLLNLSGSVTALILSLLLGIQGGILWIFLLLIFLASSFLATRYKFKYKEERGLQEGKKGERGVFNVLANGMVPLIIALLHGADNSFGLLGIGILGRSLAVFLFVTAVASAASDTLASEMGVLCDKAYLITNFKRVPPGTNGGVSAYGQLWAYIGSAYTFVVAFVVFSLLEGNVLSPSMVLIGSVLGFASCQFDSILGATLERKKIIGKSAVNVIAISITVMISWVVIWMIG